MNKALNKCINKRYGLAVLADLRTAKVKSCAYYDLPYVKQGCFHCQDRGFCFKLQNIDRH